MVSPILLIATALGLAFLMPVLGKIHKNLARSLSVPGLLGFLLISLLLLQQVIQRGGSVISQTAGFSAPLSISLGLGLDEALALVLINLLSVPALLFMLKSEGAHWKGKELALFFTLMLGLNGLVLTRDLFNLFVFMEVASISLYGLLSSGSDHRVFEGGFKYMMAGGIASAFYLIGVAFLYQRTGTLNLDHMMHLGLSNGTSGLYLPLLLLLAGILIELKPFPANGWALDSYQAADNGMGAIMSGLNTSALLLVLLKILPLIAAVEPKLLDALKWVGGLTFLLSNLAAIRQRDTRRMLGYSSIAQTGLIVLVLSFRNQIGSVTNIALLLLINHALSKMSLFWLSKLIDSRKRHDSTKSGSLRKNRLLLISIGIGVIALAALPPFPGFWAKWNLVMELGGLGQGFWIGFLLLGSLLEAFYLFRWFIRLQAEEEDHGRHFESEVPPDFPEEVEAPESSPAKELNLSVAAPLLTLTILSLTGIYLAWGWKSLEGTGLLLLVPLGALLLFWLLDLLPLPLWSKTIPAMAALGYYGYLIIPPLEGLRWIFGLVFLAGSAVQLFIFFNRGKDRGQGLLPLLMAMIFSLGNLIIMESKLDMFFSWEIMTLSSFLLIMRGKKASGGALRYLTFSLAGAFAILAGLSMVPGTGWSEFTQAPMTPLVGILLALGFLSKMGALGFHIWLPASYAESEDDVSTFLSSVLSKAGLYMLFLTASYFILPLFPQGGSAFLASINLSQILGWLGVITALAGALMAVFQEDIKYTLAYSSMSQLGYMLLAFSLFSHLGWVTSVYLAVTHLFFKALLFLAMAGVIQRTGTRLMYQMGGLIKQMPISFISVLMAIIALSGVPPLTGFGGKWLLYTSLLDKGWYLQAGLAMFASGVAFLYLFRLIHSIFLGQPKPALAHVKEAPLWGLIPQVLFMGLIMLFSMYPNLLIQPIQAAVEPFFPAAAEGISWDGATVLSSLGYWNGSAVMYVTMGVFMVPLIWLLLVQNRPQRVKQFNIVYAAERPHTPESTHYAYNFFSHYKKALGFLTNARVDRFWIWIGEGFGALGGALRRIYSGNAQTYALHILIFVLMIFFLSGGAF